MQTSENNSELRVTMVACNKLEEIEVIAIMGVLRISLVRQNSLFLRGLPRWKIRRKKKH